MLEFKEEVLSLTKELVQHPSINGTIGERDIAYKIYNYFRELPYFREHPTHLRLCKTEGDERERYNVLALVKGKNADLQETVILMGHMDTVGVEDYGKWKRLAFFPDDLIEHWREGKVQARVRQDIDTGDWICGRGTVDMKSGVAGNIALTRYYAEHLNELNGNILFVSECDEEDNSRGIQSAVKDLLHLAQEEELSYVGAINTDYTSPQFDGDENRYVYLGTVGKLLPSFFIAGKGTHAGQPFEGFDPNLVAVELTARLDYNPEFCDELYGEVTQPPVSLKQTDLKKKYDVQTPLSAFVYYNFFVHSWSPKDVLIRLKGVAEECFAAAVDQYRDRYLRFSRYSGNSRQPLETFQPRVYTYEELYEECLSRFGSEFQRGMHQFAMNLLNEKELDLREYSCKMVEELWNWRGEDTPGIVLFYSSVYFPRIVLSEKDDRERRLIGAVNRAVKEVQPHYSRPIQVRNFFPYISDMSFVAISDDPEGISALQKNMPAWGTKHRMDVEAIQSLDIPVVNIGPYGMDAHKQWERVEVPYSMQVVPNLNFQVIRHLLGM
ncbi:M20/M25/M40 family metallo-hydrolase [Paludifilum halophilum]|uniref:Peptidase M20 n=1 Tax=Paludifilum halophilum TaxID=1642702 RepID=A0A235B670_9BACL|nr:M20/M25/M40 family metallo-hydrolase [Paludifilum halophilum]OYD07731.1 peptidase M20 [Paludifilum halophilum]